MDKRPKAFVTGWPVAHSRSPIIHSYWLAQHGIEGSYVQRACEPNELTNFLTNLEKEGFVGGNVTVPHKQHAFELVENPLMEAKALGAINTVWIENGTLCGTNTDGYGFLANLDDRHPGWDAPARRSQGALVLGAGGASRAIIHALVQRHFLPVVIANRTLEKAEQLAEQFGPSCRVLEIASATPEHVNPSLIVNTTSIGMGDGASAIDLTGFDPTTLVHDIVYSPLITPLLKQAQTLGMPFVDGLGMLLHQAVPGFEKWFGVRPQVDDTLRGLILRDLGEDS